MSERDTGDIKKTQIKLPEMKNVMPGMKTRLDTEEEKTDELEDITTETVNNETQRKKDGQK